MTGGSVLLFNEGEHKAIYKHLQDLPKHHEFLEDSENFTVRLTRKRWTGTLNVSYSKLLS
jgi:hypothetical protein